jgi:hypothetical protein
VEPFTTIRDASLALLNGASLTQREGQFLGGIAFADYGLSPKQLNWLVLLLARHGLPPLAPGVGE